MMAVAAGNQTAKDSPNVERKPRSVGHALLVLLRPHQWFKNVLILVPVALSHQWNTFGVLTNAILATLCFCLAASAVYVTNDLLDIEADREHPSKCFRPLAAGEVGKGAALGLALVLFALAAVIALRLPLAFGITLLIYVAVSSLYSLYLKTKVILDICTLAGLYTIRLFAGGEATGIPISEWTLAFAMFCFLGLAAVKRYSELRALPQETTYLSRRGYGQVDQSVVLALGMTSMMVSVLVLALYLHSPEVVVLYRHPQALWLICPVMLYWFGRIWIIAGRGWMHSDPILFALRDRTSLLAAIVIIVIGLLCK
jgi:4-hydroxybenzoate polyprenyltransferase